MRAPATATAIAPSCGVIEMSKDADKPGRHEDDREGQVHEDTAKKIDPSKYGTDDDGKD